MKTLNNNNNNNNRCESINYHPVPVQQGGISLIQIVSVKTTVTDREEGWRRPQRRQVH
jgi:hypothetical protein